MTTPNSLAAFRATKDLTLEAAGTLFGVDKSTFLRWERGRVPPERAVEISRLTEIPLHVLRPDIFPVPAKPEQAA